MARFVPRMQRGRRPDSGSEKLESSQQEAVVPATDGTPRQVRRTPRQQKTRGIVGKPDEIEGPDEVDGSTQPEAGMSAAQYAASDREEAAAASPRRVSAKSTRGRVSEAARPKRPSAGTPVRSRSGRKDGRPERGGSGRKVVSAPRAGSNRRERAAQAVVSKLRRTALNLAVWAAVVALVLASAWYWQRHGQQLEDARRDAMAAARDAAVSIFSYDYRAFDESVSNGNDFVTGAFKAEYAKTTAGLEKSVKKEKAIVRAEVSAASVTDATLERAEILLFVNQFRRNVNISGEKVDENRVLLTMVYLEEQSGDGAWLVSAAAAI